MQKKALLYEIGQLCLLMEEFMQQSIVNFIQKDKVHISIMNGKLEGLKAISSNTITNPYCQKQFTSGNADNICTKCYSNIMLNGYRKNMQSPLQSNSNLLSNSIIPDNQLPIILEAFFRFNAHGELINEIHLQNLMNITLKNPSCNFALWTKQNGLIKKYFDNNPKPNNLILIYSNPKINSIMDKLPKHFDKTFNNVLETDYQDQQNCTGQQCKTCLLCYKHNGISKIVEKVKKY
jgi:hypothetical protein